jgi:hypothetical protein
MKIQTGSQLVFPTTCLAALAIAAAGCGGSVRAVTAYRSPAPRAVSQRGASRGVTRTRAPTQFT